MNSVHNSTQFAVSCDAWNSTSRRDTCVCVADFSDAASHRAIHPMKSSSRRMMPAVERASEQDVSKIPLVLI